MLPHQQSNRNVDDVCAILVSIMAHGCFIGPYTMARLTQGVSYDKIHDITDWQLTEEAQRTALATVVNAITNLDISKQWGDGTTFIPLWQIITPLILARQLNVRTETLLM